jgi:hypothetical protein
MNFIGGLILLAVFVALLFFGRGGRDGEPRSFLRNWLIGQMFALAVLLVGLIGVGTIILNWPF